MANCVFLSPQLFTTCHWHNSATYWPSAQLRHLNLRVRLSQRRHAPRSGSPLCSIHTSTETKSGNADSNQVFGRMQRDQNQLRASVIVQKYTPMIIFYSFLRRRPLIKMHKWECSAAWPDRKLNGRERRLVMATLSEIQVWLLRDQGNTGAATKMRASFDYF